ncbi:MAG: DUF4153 domain-containing protein [Lachnospiraceae bacterium]|nr:DUF4153 domain-containing protein [Lachnospiraceae bacterium]
MSEEKDIEEKDIEEKDIENKDIDNNGIEGKRTNKITKLLCRLLEGVRDTIKDYPVTLISVIIAALLGALCIGDSSDYLALNDLYEKGISFFLIMSAQVILYEEIFRKKTRIRIAGCFLSAIISAVYVFILFNDNEIVFGAESEAVKQNFIRFLAVYLTVMILGSIYHMYKRLEEDFEVFCTRAFLELCKTTFIYGLFAVGLAIIVLIFNELIFDTGDFLEQLELFLAGGIYSAMCLKAVSKKNDPPGKFAGICIVYVLQPMLIISFIIIYVYIIKIFVTDSIPSNTIFGILAFLFSVGMPIFTMINGSNSENMLLKKGSKFLPYAFIPFIFLQVWSMGIRIQAHGFTVPRYGAVVLIVCEVIYFILYLIHHITHNQSISLILFFLMVIAALVLVVPGICFDDVVINSQIKRLDEALANEELSKEGKHSVYSAYREIYYVSYRGERILENKYEEALRDEINDYDDINIGGGVNFDYNKGEEEINISGYNMLYNVTDCEYTQEYSCLIKSAADKDYTVDLTELYEWIDDNYSDERNYVSLDLTDRNLYRIDDKRDLYITSLYTDYDVSLGKVEYININGYILEK